MQATGKQPHFPEREKVFTETIIIKRESNKKENERRVVGHHILILLGVPPPCCRAFPVRASAEAGEGPNEHPLAPE